MHDFVDDNKDEAFDVASTVVMTGLSEAAETIQTKLNDSLADLSVTVSVCAGIVMRRDCLTELTDGIGREDYCCPVGRPYQRRPPEAR